MEKNGVMKIEDLNQLDEFLENIESVDKLNVLTNLLLFRKNEIDLYYLEFAPSAFLQMHYTFKDRILKKLNIDCTSGTLFFIKKEGVTI